MQITCCRYQVIKIGPVTDADQLAVVRGLQELCDDDEVMTDTFIIVVLYGDTVSDV